MFIQNFSAMNINFTYFVFLLSSLTYKCFTFLTISSIVEFKELIYICGNAQMRIEDSLFGIERRKSQWCIPSFWGNDICICPNTNMFTINWNLGSSIIYILVFIRNRCHIKSFKIDSNFLYNDNFCNIDFV